MMQVPISTSGETDAILSLHKEMRCLPGCGFGIRTPVILGKIDIRLPLHFDLEKIEKVMAEFADEPVKYVTTSDKPEVHLVSRIHEWSSLIQRDSRIPVFGKCTLWAAEADEGRGSATQVGFALPCHTRICSEASLQFVIKAIKKLGATTGDPEIVLPDLRNSYHELMEVLSEYTLNSTNQFQLIKAAYYSGIEFRPMVERIWAFGLGQNQSHFDSSITNATPALSVRIAHNKLLCGKLLSDAGLPVARNALVANVEMAVKLALQIGYPVVIKPVDAEQGRGVTSGIMDEADLIKAYSAATKVSNQVMIEKHQQGSDYRVTVLHGKAVKVMNRRPGGVTGDGSHTVAELVATRNAEIHANRSYRRKKRPPLLIDDEAQFQLTAIGLTPSSIISRGQFVPLRRRANISAGGSYDVLSLNDVHPDNLQLGENAANILGLDIAGIDIISDDPRISWRESGGIICEVNAQPQIGSPGSENLYRKILTSATNARGHIPVHLMVVHKDHIFSAPPQELLQVKQCNAAAWSMSGWIAGAGMFGPFPNVFRAAKGILLNRLVSGAIVAMTEPELLRFGLPISCFETIQILGPQGWKPTPIVRQMLAEHHGSLPIS
jgi:cyanophycin synthetase